MYVPAAMRKQVLAQLHAAHQGFNKTMDRASRTVWWPTIRNEVQQTIAGCVPCREHLPSQTHQPLLQGPKAKRPFQVLHADLCHHAGNQFLVLTDEYSGWPDLYALRKDTTARAIINALRGHFMAHTVPETFRPDNGPQFVAAETATFLDHWQVHLSPSAPHLPRTNGRAEAAVKAVKRILRGATAPGTTTPDPDKVTEGIIAFRNTPRFGGRSPAEWVYGRQIKDRLPTHHTAFSPRWQRDWATLDAREAATKKDAGDRYNLAARRHPPLTVGTRVWVQDHISQRWDVAATITERDNNDIYALKQPSGRVLKRNRVHIRPRAPELAPPEAEDQQAGPSRPPPAQAGARPRATQSAQEPRPRRITTIPARYRT